MSEVLDIAPAPVKRVDYGPLNPRPHPMLPVPPQAEIDAMFAAGREAEYLAWYNEREKLIHLAENEEEGDPFRYGWELPHWLDADKDLKQDGNTGQYVAGGKRATKSERAAKRVVQAAMYYGRGKIWCFQGDIKTSIATQQQLIWKYLPHAIKQMNGKARHGFAKVNYSQDGGFTERNLVLPNRTEIHFLTYNQDPKEYQGWAIGAPTTEVQRENAPQHVHNIGAWLDEDAPLVWLDTVEFRCTTHGAVWMWTFSTMEGITPAVKQVLGTPRTLKQRKAELLPQDRKYVEDCEPGHVPYIQRSTKPRVSVIYFHTDLNPFPPNYQNVTALCEGKPDAYVLENAYGYSEDTTTRAFPNFGPLNIIDPERIPPDGTNYFFTDPAGTRMWASFWVRVTPGDPPTLFIYRDWPSEQKYGAWAVPSADPNQRDGDRGPGQRGRGYGYNKLKQLWLAEERIIIPPADVFQKLDVLTPGTREHSALLRRFNMQDPMRRRIARRAAEGQDDRAEIFEPIRRNYIDPRAGKSQHAAAQGGTCAIDELNKEGKDDHGNVVPRRHFEPAAGLHIEEGVQAVNSLLEWDKNKAPDPVMNYPHLFVSSECRQVIWMFEHYTAMGGEEGGCKDFADIVRYMALARLRYVSPGAVKTKGGGSY